MKWHGSVDWRNKAEPKKTARTSNEQQKTKGKMGTQVICSVYDWFTTNRQLMWKRVHILGIGIANLQLAFNDIRVMGRLTFARNQGSPFSQ